MDHVISNPKVQILLSKTDEYLGRIGYTEHGIRHSKLVSHIAYNILDRLGYPEREKKLAEIAGYLHDIGNSVNRLNHAETGALMAYDILSELNFKYEDIIDICAAIGNHNEEEGKPVSVIASALIIADKTDVHKSRVRTDADIKIDIHDRVNWAVEKSFLNVDADKRIITLQLTIDTSISPAIEYFQIFMERLQLSRKAADALGCKLHIEINGTKLL